VFLIPAALLVAVVAFVAVSLNHPSSTSPASTGERGLAVGAAVPTTSLPATMGGSMSLSDLRGSKVVVYFFEGDG